MNSQELEAHLIECLPDGGRLGDVRARIDSKFPNNPASGALISVAVARMLLAEFQTYLKNEGGENGASSALQQINAHRFVDLWAEFVANRRLVAETLLAPNTELLAIVTKKLARLNRDLIDELSRRKGYAAMAPVGDFLREIGS